MNFRLDDMPHKLRTDVILSDRDTHEQFSDKLRFIFIELPSFTKEEADCETDFDRWIYVLKNMETLKRLPFKARKAVFQKLEKIVDMITNYTVVTINIVNECAKRILALKSDVSRAGIKSLHEAVI